MTRRRAALLALLVLVIAVAFIPVRSVGEKITSGQLLWNSEEAYVLIGVRRLGWNESAGRFLRDVLMVLAQYGASPQDSRSRVVLLRITPRSVETHVAEGIPIGDFDVLDDTISNGAYRWTGNGLEPLVPKGAGVGRNWPRVEFTNSEGWSKRNFLPVNTPPEGVNWEIELAGQRVTLIVTGKVLQSTTIDVRRGDQPPERVWSLEGESRLVTGKEYARIFGK